MRSASRSTAKGKALCGLCDSGCYADDAMAEPQDEGADYKPAQSIGEALQVAKSIYDNDGQMSDAGNDRETIARQVFGDMAQPQAPGQLNRKSSLKGGY